MADTTISPIGGDMTATNPVVAPNTPFQPPVDPTAPPKSNPSQSPANHPQDASSINAPEHAKHHRHRATSGVRHMIKSLNPSSGGQNTNQSAEAEGNTKTSNPPTSPNV